MEYQEQFLVLKLSKRLYPISATIKKNPRKQQQNQKNKQQQKKPPTKIQKTFNHYFNDRSFCLSIQWHLKSHLIKLNNKWITLTTLRIKAKDALSPDTETWHANDLPQRKRIYNLAKQTILSRLFIFSNKTPLQQLQLFAFSTQIFLLPFCSSQSDKKASEMTMCSENQQWVKPPSQIWVLFEILTAFSEKINKTKW